MSPTESWLHVSGIIQNMSGIVHWKKISKATNFVEEKENLFTILVEHKQQTT